MKISDKLYICCIIFTMITVATISTLLIYASIVLYFTNNPTFADIGMGCLGTFFAVMISWDIIGDGIRILKGMKKKTDDRRIH